MSESSDPNGFRLDEVVEWCNQAGPGARPNGTACIIVGPLDFYEWMDEINGGVDFGFGYPVRDAHGEWLAFSRELRKREPPGPDWVTLCCLDQVGADWEVSRTAKIDPGLLHTLLDA